LREGGRGEGGRGEGGRGEGGRGERRWGTKNRTKQRPLPPTPVSPGINLARTGGPKHQPRTSPAATLVNVPAGLYSDRIEGQPKPR
ncbi:hypothetical protein Pcinc_017254, partial [Petrolisthes cinctipes]